MTAFRPKAVARKTDHLVFEPCQSKAEPPLSLRAISDAQNRIDSDPELPNAYLESRERASILSAITNCVTSAFSRSISASSSDCVNSADRTSCPSLFQEKHAFGSAFCRDPRSPTSSLTCQVNSSFIRPPSSPSL